MLQDLIGQTKNKKLIDESYKIYLEKFHKTFPEYFEKNHSKAFALVTITKNLEVLDIGMSKVDDLLNNNWGFFLQQFLSGDSGLNSNYFNTVGSNRGLRIWGIQSHLFNQVDGGAEGSRIATGSGVTPATRSDFNIETQENKASTGDGGWNSGLGKIDIPMVTTAVSNYSITETALIGAWYSHTQLGIAELLLSRDNISPVAVLIGQTINVDYNLLLS